ncbi:MAG: RloB family protein [Dermabacter sp.]|nr:RloB family protein [Dermabacter sp.]
MKRGERRRSVRPRRQLAERILVVTEGTRTERLYVEGLGRYLRSRDTTAIVKTVPVGKDPLKVVHKCIETREEATRRGKGYDHCVCLVDVDDHHTLRVAAQLADEEGILLLISNLKFEVWLRWHTENKRSPENSKQLDRIVTDLGLVEGKILSPSFPYDGVHGACVTARAADPEMQPGVPGANPSSHMPILVDLMQGKAPR